MKIKVNQEMCIGCGMCQSMCPAVFKLNAEGKSEVISDKDLDCAIVAAKACPVNAISVSK
jgi:ferredoxin